MKLKEPISSSSSSSSSGNMDSLGLLNKGLESCKRNLEMDTAGMLRYRVDPEVTSSAKRFSFEVKNSGQIPFVPAAAFPEVEEDVVRLM